MPNIFMNVTKNIDWNTLDGIILLNHGVFTFDNDAKKAYEKMIDIVTKAEEYLAQNVTLPSNDSQGNSDQSLIETLARRGGTSARMHYFSYRHRFCSSQTSQHTCPILNE